MIDWQVQKGLDMDEEPMNILKGIGKAFISNTTVVGAGGVQGMDCKV